MVYTGTEGIFGGRTELIEVSGTGTEAEPNGTDDFDGVFTKQTEIPLVSFGAYSTEHALGKFSSSSTIYPFVAILLQMHRTIARTRCLGSLREVLEAKGGQLDDEYCTWCAEDVDKKLFLCDGDDCGRYVVVVVVVVVVVGGGACAIFMVVVVVNVVAVVAVAVAAGVLLSFLW